MPPLTWVIAVLVAGCGRIGFTDLDDDPRLQLHVTFEAMFDDVAKGRSVTCVGPCPTLEVGDTSVAASFDGTQYLTIPSAPALEAQEFTLAVWFRSPDARIHTLVSKPLGGATTRDNSYQLWKAPNGTVVFSTAGPTATTVGIVTDDAWHHAAATYAAGVVQTFLDGVPQMSSTVLPTSYAADELLIGCDLDIGAPFGFWTGQLDDVRYYSRALAAYEVAALAE